MISNNLKKRLYTSLILLSLTVLIFNFNMILIYCLIILGILSILEFLNLTKKICKKKLNFILLNFLFIIYIFVFCIMFFFFSNFIGLKIILYILLLACIASDIGGYIFGKIFKGPKLTKISPNKTYAGAFGSIIVSLIITTTLFFYTIKILDFKIIVIAITTSVFCQLGDLLFSFLKRKAKLEDTGNFLPGHGGILDRLDGIFLGIPFGFLALVLLN